MITTTNPDLIAAYKWHKARLASYVDAMRDVQAREGSGLARRSLELARADVAAGKKRYPQSPGHSAAGAPFDGYGTKAMRWCESPADLGLRFVGYADKLARIDHSGWYADDFQDSLIRGVVYQLPARNGHVRYVSGYDNEDNGAADSGGPAAIDFGTLWEGEAGDYYNSAADNQGARDAANHADSLAERTAETERDYNRAWQAGSQYAGRGEEIAGRRRELLALLADRRRIRMDSAWHNSPACKVVLQAIMDGLAFIKEAREERESLASGNGIGRDYELGFYPSAELKAAFNEGAGEVVLA